MKKLIAFLSLITLTLTACGQTNKPIKFYDTFEKTDWGMTQEECKQVMKLDDKSLLPLEDGMFHGFKAVMNVYGEQSDVDFLFVGQIGELKQELGLGMVFIKIDDCDAIEVYKKLCKQLEVEVAEMGEEKVDFNQIY